jgi:2-oxoglutarate dehydrogenase E1 component
VGYRVRVQVRGSLTGEVCGRACVSDLTEMQPDTFFRRVIVESSGGDNMAGRQYKLVPPYKMRKLVLCSGQIFYDLYHARAARKVDDVLLVRIEQLAPFPFDRIAAVLSKYSDARWCWAQQEPKNMGAWSFVHPRLKTAVKKLCPEMADKQFEYVGRSVAASPATGLFRVHQEESKQILDQVFSH